MKTIDNVAASRIGLSYLRCKFTTSYYCGVSPKSAPVSHEVC